MSAYFHIWAAGEDWAGDEFAFDLDEETLTEQVLKPYWSGKPLSVNGRPTYSNALTRLNVFRSDQPSSVLLQQLRGTEQALRMEPEEPAERRLLGLTTNVTAEYLRQPPAGWRRARPGAEGSRSQADKRADRRNVLLIHGPRSQLAQGMRTFLNALDLRVYAWSEVAETLGVGAPDARQILDEGFATAHAAVVLLEPDDLVSPHPRPGATGTPPDPVGVQPHPSVLFEAGLAWQKDRDRTLFIEFAHFSPFRSLEGVDRIPFDGSAASRDRLAERLRKLKCRVNRQGESWLEAGTFPLPPPPIRLLERVPLKWVILSYLAEVHGHPTWGGRLDLPWIRSQTGAHSDAVRAMLDLLLADRLIEPLPGSGSVTDGTCRITDDGLALLANRSAT
jgi:Predicted nucleotide-binding protein containing TIR-like domain